MQQNAARIYIKGPNSVVKMLELALNKQTPVQVTDMNSWHFMTMFLCRTILHFFQYSQNIIECDESIHVSVYPCLFFHSDLARTACFVAAWTLREVCYVQRVFKIWRRFLLDGLRSLRYHAMLLRTGKRSSKRGREPAHDRSGNSGYGIAFEPRGTPQERPKQVRMVRCYPTFSLTMLLLQANWARCAHPTVPN